MSAHSVILVLGRQTSVSPALITYLNHEKLLQRYQVQSHKFFLRSHNSMYEKTSSILQHATPFTQDLSVPNDFFTAL
jgi:hypothetical protein